MTQAAQNAAQSRVNPTKRDRTKPITNTLHKVVGYGTLTIYKMEASPFWYSALHAKCRSLVGQKIRVDSKAGKFLRNVEITQEVYDLIIFMSNSFIRPTDIKVLQHKHVAVIRGQDTYLRLTHPPTKNHGGPVVTMERAVVVYDDLLQRQREEGFGTKEDYLFCPNQLNRDYALRDITRQFDQVLKAAGLKITPNGETRTLYSLRHTCIMFRLINGDNIEPLTLARNARTSYEMIDRFYAKHLTAEMNIAQLQSGAKVD